MLETEKKDKNVTVDKIKALFRKIKNFEQLKEEVYDIKKTCQNNFEEISRIKGKNSMNNNMKELNSFEGMREESHYREIMEEKINEIDKKFNVILGGDFKVDDFDEDEVNNININIKNNKDNNDEIDNNNNNKDETNNSKGKNIIKSKEKISSKDINSYSKNKKNKKNKLINLVEINRRIIQYQNSKVNLSDFEQNNLEYKNNLKEIDKKLNDIYDTLYGTNEKRNPSGYNNNSNIQKFYFMTKTEFEEYKSKTNNEINKLWEEIESLKKKYEEYFSSIKNKCNLEDLDAMKNVILEKTQELFLKINNNTTNKDTDSNAIHVLQKNFKKLLELLAEKEEQEKWLLANKPIGGHSCASCENYLGSLKDGTDKFVHWNKLPLKEKDKENKDKIYKIGNGYSRLLRMIHFDKKGIPSLNPYESNVNINMNNSVSNFSINNMNENNNNNEENNNLSIRSIHSINSKNKSKENNNHKTIILSKTRNKPTDNKEKKLPNIKVWNSTDYYEKVGNNLNSSNNNINFKSPRMTREYRKRYYKFDL